MSRTIALILFTVALPALGAEIAVNVRDADIVRNGYAEIDLRLKDVAPEGAVTRLGIEGFLCPVDNSAPGGRERNHRSTPCTQNKRSLISVKHCRCQLGNDLRRQSEVVLRKEFFLLKKLGGTQLNCLALFMESNNGLS